MTGDEALYSRSSAKPGANWVRAALQVNPYSYQGLNAPSSRFTNESDYNSALIAKCKAENIEIIAVTDHWNVDTALQLLSDAKDAGIVGLPGFEANTSEGIHLLVIFGEDTKPADVNAAIGQCGERPGATNGSTGSPFQDVLEKMNGMGALVIPAHANVPNSGMLTGRSGVPLVNMIKSAELHAIGITPSHEPAADQAAIAAGTRPYDRVHPISVIHADDICNPDTLATEGATTWFKLSNKSVDSLRLAVRTPSTRVSLTDPASTPRALIRKISWTGGLLDGVELPLADDLTTLIGGRGTGKSTVIESIRFALEIPAIGDAARKDHSGIVSNVLESGTIVRIHVETVTPIPGTFVIQRTVFEPAIVYDSSAMPTNFRPVDILGHVEIFGQHELAELAQDKLRVAQMIERFTGRDNGDGERLEILKELAENRTKLEHAEKTVGDLEKELSEIPRLTDHIDHFKESELPTQLEEQARLQRDEAIFAEGASRIETAQTKVDTLTGVEVIDTLKSEFEGLEESPEKTILQRVSAATSKLATEIENAYGVLSAALDAAQRELASAKSDWDSIVTPKRAVHAEIRRALSEQGHDPEKYLAFSTSLERLKAKIPRRESLLTTVSVLQSDRDGLILRLVASESAITERLHDAIRNANNATGGTVVVRPVASPDRKAIENLIVSHVQGQRGQIMSAIAQESFSTRAFVAAIRSGPEAIEEKYGIKGAQAAGLLAAALPLCRLLEEQNVGLAVDVLLDVSATRGARTLKKLEDLSKGQRATALLLLLLGASASPLVIDQPEDDLDNRFVYEGVVQKLRELKGQRQIIVSTHNANVPVLGDAELVVALEGDGRRSWPTENGIGSLDDETVRCLAEDLLEGGRAAFDARQHLYGF